MNGGVWIRAPKSYLFLHRTLNRLGQIDERGKRKKTRSPYYSSQIPNLFNRALHMIHLSLILAKLGTPSTFDTASGAGPTRMDTLPHSHSAYLPTYLL